MTKAIKKFQRWAQKHPNTKIDKTRRELMKVFKIGSGSIWYILKKFNIKTKGHILNKFCKYKHEIILVGKYPTGQCKACTSKNANKWKKDNIDLVRDRYFRKTFGISLDFYNKLFKKQKGRCAICKIHQNELKTKIKKTLVVDHDHKTGKIRGLLCYKCNVGLGYFNDSRKNLQVALEYLS